MIYSSEYSLNVNNKMYVFYYSVNYLLPFLQYTCTASYLIKIKRKELQHE